MSTTTATAPARQRKPRPKPARTIRLAVGPSADSPACVVVITVGRKSQDYYVQPLPADFGRAYQVEKIFTDAPETYHVNLGDDGTHQCDCQGFLQWNHCKHSAGLQALHAAGQL